MIGLAGESQSVVIASGQTATLSFAMTPSALVLGGIEVLAEKSEALTTPRRPSRPLPRPGFRASSARVICRSC